MSGEKRQDTQINPRALLPKRTCQSFKSRRSLDTTMSPAVLCHECVYQCTHVPSAHHVLHPTVYVSTESNVNKIERYFKLCNGRMSNNSYLQNETTSTYMYLHSKRSLVRNSLQNSEIPRNQPPIIRVPTPMILLRKREQESGKSKPRPRSHIPQHPRTTDKTKKYVMIEKKERNARNQAPGGFATSHLFKHSSDPQFDPVPTGVIFLRTSSLASSCPKAAFTSSDGKPLAKTWPMLVVPASEESRAETSWAFLQPVPVGQ